MSKWEYMPAVHLCNEYKYHGFSTLTTSTLFQSFGPSPSDTCSRLTNPSSLMSVGSTFTNCTVPTKPSSPLKCSVLIKHGFTSKLKLERCSLKCKKKHFVKSILSFWFEKSRTLIYFENVWISIWPKAVSVHSFKWTKLILIIVLFAENNESNDTFSSVSVFNTISVARKTFVLWQNYVFPISSLLLLIHAIIQTDYCLMLSRRAMGLWDSHFWKCHVLIGLQGCIS